MMRMREDRSCPRPSPSRRSPHLKRAKASRPELFKRSQVKFLNRSNTETIQKSSGVVVFLVDGRTVDEGDSVLKSGSVRGGQVANELERLFSFQKI